MTERPPPAPGRLHVVSTPIGNLGDLSPRAAEVLTGVAVIACEDTRRTGRLLDLTGLTRRGELLRLDDHTEARATGVVVDRLGAGDDVALVSDAGTPTVSDPGQRLVAATVAAGHPVVAVPGPSAALAALVVSALPTDRFTVDGFPPRRGTARRRCLGEVAASSRTTVLFEAPHRVVALLDDLAAACGPDRPVAVCRELTKRHEETWRGCLGTAAAAVGEPRGEYVVVVGPAPVTGVDDAAIGAELRRQLEGGASTRDAVRLVSAELGVARNRVYRLAQGASP